MPLIGEARSEATRGREQRLPASAMTALVRVRFRVGEEGPRLRALALRARFAEGLVAWIDGVEQARRYVAPGAGPDTPSLQIHGSEWETFYLPVRKGLLGPGEHVLALEVHAHKPLLGPLVEATLSGFDATRIVRGPYLLRPGPTEMTVAWDTDSDATGEVRYGLDDDHEGLVKSPLPLRHHALRVRGLRASCIYHYRVVAGDADSGDAGFHTLPGPEEPLRFVVYGDTRNGHDVHARLAAEVLREDPDLLVTLGDLVDRGSEEADWQKFFEVAAPLLRAIPIVPALGNHEIVRAEGLAHFLELFPSPPGGSEPGYFGFDAAGVHFTVLDSNQLRSPRQLAFCDADLARSQRARARFVIMHQGPWSMGFHGNHPDAIRAYAPVFARRNVSMIFSGHDHQYERGRMGGLDYVISGGGGAPLYVPRCGGLRAPCPSTTFFITPEYHYVLVEVEHDGFKLCAKRIDGTPLEPCVDYPSRRVGARLQ